MKFAKRRKPAGYRNLIQIETDAKTAKGTDHGYLTGIMYLAPSTMSGLRDMCTSASAGCIYACLVTSGRAEYLTSINEARIAKTRFLVEQPEAFYASLEYDVETVRRRALKRGLIPAVRINGTSDDWGMAARMARLFPDVQFYDYTKHPRPQLRVLPNYHLTFSHSEVNLSACLDALAHGINVAVVFGTRKGQPLPETWNGYPVYNGDETDLRFTDPRGVVVGLYAKGRARKDCTGFVVRESQLISIAA